MSSLAAEARALLRAGRADDAERLLRDAMARGAEDADSLHMLGFLLATRGRAAEGLELLDRSIGLAPRHPGYRDTRAQVLLQLGRVDEALRDARAVTELDPGFGDGWLRLSQALRRSGQAREALEAVGRALQVRPDDTGANYQAAVLRKDLGDHAAAEPHLRRVLERDPRHVAAHVLLGIVERELGREAAALECFTRALALDPRNAEAHNNLGLALQQGGRTEEALRSFDAALALRPAFPEALINRGNALVARGSLEEARASFAAALAARPGDPDALLNAGSVALDLGLIDEARSMYDRALQARPGFADALYGLAQVALREHRFAIAWEGYQRRFDTQPPQAAQREFAMPQLTPGNLAQARRVAVWSEQGLGDQILFSTLLPELERRGIEAVVEVDARLLGLYRRSLPFFTFTPRGESPRAFADCDAHVPVGSLARLFRRDLSDFDAQPTRLLKADPERVAALRLEPMIAISWRSPLVGKRAGFGRRKSIPLEDFADLAARTGLPLLDLQYGDVEAERREFESRHPGVLRRIEGLDARDDLEGVAAALVSSRRLVTSSTAIAHLAGALGVPTRLVHLHGVAPFSYWVPRADGRSLWYPSVTVAAQVA